MAIVFFSDRLLKAIQSVSFPVVRSFWMMRSVVASQDAKIVDLDAYRARRAGERAQQLDVPVGSRSNHVQMGVMPFLFPAVFFVFWPTWVFVPQFGQVQTDYSNGLA